MEKKSERALQDQTFRRLVKITFKTVRFSGISKHFQRESYADVRQRLLPLKLLYRTSKANSPENQKLRNGGRIGHQRQGFSTGRAMGAVRYI